ncbi:transglutaminase-like domain-containing protein [Ornithinimicrobium cavernae]|uniref:transglutaminase-like domain-containing protein n=1 Tax=Ornithinimicrobium cavernae TaxID=2666047 RepID=UPI000D697EEF|nr:transglutaminase-like domain-containing protein [Ornithinimicrobium cavernae]
MTETEPFRPSRHTRYSDPGPWGHLLAAVDPDVESVSAAARNLIVHYREDQAVLPPHTRSDIHGRWLVRTLDRDQERHGSRLAEHRELTERVQGCCRDHALFACAVLRQHGIAARGRVGFARYLNPGFCHDHVVVEARLPAGGGRWVRFDPELTGPRGTLETPMDMPFGLESPFITAAEAWRGWRAGDLDAQEFGACPNSPVRGPWFIQNYVLRDVAHRHGDELLLWDAWGGMAAPGEQLSPETVALTDRVAALTVAADAGASAAEAELTRLYTTSPRLRPGPTVRRHDPFAVQAPPVVESLSAPRPAV